MILKKFRQGINISAASTLFIYNRINVQVFRTSTALLHYMHYMHENNRFPLVFTVLNRFHRFV